MIHDFVLVVISTLCLWFCLLEVHSIVDLLHAEKRRWSYPWSSLNVPSVYFLSKTLNANFENRSTVTAITRSPKASSADSVYRGQSTQVTRTSTLQPLLPDWTPSKHSFSSSFLWYDWFLQKIPTASQSTASSDPNSCMFRLTRHFPLHWYAATLLCFQNSFSLLKYVLRWYGVCVKKVYMGAGPSGISHTFRHFRTSIACTTLTHTSAEPWASSSPSILYFLVNTCRAWSRISYGIGSLA